MFLWFPVLDLARAPRRAARKKGSGYENGSRLEQELEIVAGLSKSFGLIEIQLPEKYKENIRSFLATTYIDTDAYANYWPSN